MTFSPQEDLELAIDAARAAGGVVMQAFRTDQEVRYKSADQPLTDADLAADALLKSRLLGARPAYGWLSEETADTGDRLERERLWIVDPIDGTRSFISGRAEFAISIGMVERGTAIVGVVYNPATDELYTGVKGAGARVNGREIRLSEMDRKPIIAASRSEISRGEFDEFDAAFELQPTGSTAYKLARVAEGKADVFLSRGPKSEWDVCAAALIVEEAGGRVTDAEGAPLQYNRADPNIRGVLAAGAVLHEEVLQQMKEAK